MKKHQSAHFRTSKLGKTFAAGKGPRSQQHLKYGVAKVPAAIVKQAKSKLKKLGVTDPQVRRGNGFGWDSVSVGGMRKRSFVSVTFDALERLHSNAKAGIQKVTFFQGMKFRDLQKSRINLTKRQPKNMTVGEIKAAMKRLSK